MGRLFKYLWRAGRLRCPRCGGGPLFRRFAMASFCPKCGLLLDRESGFYIGAVAINLVVAELLFVVMLVAWVALTWPDVAWGTIQIVTPIAMILSPILFWPFSRTIWLAISLALFPAERREVIGDYRVDSNRRG